MPPTNAIDGDEIRAWGGAVVYAAPFGTAMPVDHVEALTTAWVHLGELTEDGIGFTSDPTFNSVMGYNSMTPYRRIPTGEEISVEVSLLQWNSENHKIVNGGGTITQVAAAVGPPAVTAHVKYEPPTISARVANFKAVLLHLSDGTGTLRRCIPKALVTSGGGFTTAKGDGSPIAVTFSILQPDVGSAWYDLIGGLDTSGFAVA